MKKEGEVIIRLNEVSKFYPMGDAIVKAVNGISLSVRKGDFVVIMGPSGSGKSTSMHLIGTLDIPTRGQIYLEGKNISSMSESDLAILRGKNIGFVFQQFNLIPTLTVRENIMLPMSLQKYSAEEKEKKVDELLKKMGLSERANHFPNQISGGQQQRVAIARALANDPEVILADEPTGNLDSATGRKVMELLSKLHKEGKTIVMVTHEYNLIRDYAHIVYWIRDGKIEKIVKGPAK